jgi:hypothetical protein
VALGSSRQQNQPDAEAVRRVVRPLSALWERPDGGDPPADQRQVERRDHQSANDAPGGFATARQGGGHDRRPADRDREVNGRGGGQQHRGTPLMRQHHGAGGAAPFQHVVAACQRPHRGRDRRTSRPSQPGCQGVTGDSSEATAAHASIVARPDPPLAIELPSNVLPSIQESHSRPPLMVVVHGGGHAMSPRRPGCPSARARASRSIVIGMADFLALTTPAA